MRREISGYSIRSRGETGTGFMFFLILLLPFFVALFIFGPAGVLQFFSPVLDGILQRVGATSAIADARADAPVAAVAAPIRLPSANWDVKDGHFFTQTNGLQPLSSPTGFLVSNASGVPFWNEFRRLGGESHLGYPVSQRFAWRGATVQVFQRGAIQHRGADSVTMVNLLDEVTALGRDALLVSKWFIPRPVAGDFGSPGDPVAARLGLLAANAPIDLRFKSTPEALTLFGLPTSAPTSMNDHVVTLRTQRGALHLWKSDGPWGKANDVTAANSGEIALESGLFAEALTTPEAPPAS